jgi:hypothetical protein
LEAPKKGEVWLCRYIHNRKKYILIRDDDEKGWHSYYIDRIGAHRRMAVKDSSGILAPVKLLYKNIL